MLKYLWRQKSVTSEPVVCKCLVYCCVSRALFVLVFVLFWLVGFLFGFVCLFWGVVVCFGWEAFYAFILKGKCYFEEEFWNSWVKIRRLYITDSQYGSVIRSKWKYQLAFCIDSPLMSLHLDSFFLAFSQRSILKDLNPACIRKGEVLQHNYTTGVALVLPFWSHPFSCLFCARINILPCL